MNLPPYIKYPVLDNNHIKLRELTIEDIAEIVEISFYDAVQAKSTEDAIIMQGKIHKNYLEGNSIHWLIVDSISNQIYGTCGYYRGFENGSGELGCVLLSNFYGRGIMSQALQMAIQFGQETIGLNQIFAITNIDNLKAIKLLERLNFEKIANLEDNQIQFELINSNK